jgi:hypothetical protein
MQDISAFLEYKFFEENLYLDPDESFPSSKEKPGWWLGVAHNVGDTMTFKILTNDNKKIIFRSVLRPAKDDRFPNKRVRFEPDSEEVDNADEKGTLSYAPRRLKIDQGLLKRKKIKQVRRQERCPQSGLPPSTTAPKEQDHTASESTLSPYEHTTEPISPPSPEPASETTDRGNDAPDEDTLFDTAPAAQ